MFYCWPDTRACWQDRTEIMKLLHDQSKLVTYEAETKAWTALQRAAAFGNRQDMELMLRIWRACNGDVHSRSQPIGWEAIHYAVQAGNLSTFSVLLEDYSDTVKELFDARGRSLLHIAATRPFAASPDDISSDPTMIVRSLLERGCDPYSRTPPTRADNLDRVVCTPETMAQKLEPTKHICSC
jgi:ankyrin repeat protein